MVLSLAQTMLACDSGHCIAHISFQTNYFQDSLLGKVGLGLGPPVHRAKPLTCADL